MQARLFLVVVVFITGMFSSLFSQLNGTYTIGGTSPNYATLTAAAAALNTSGISGNVTFNIRPGTYNERINIQSVPGNNAGRTILFKAENNDSSSVVIATTSASNVDNYVVSVQNTQNVQFSRLTFRGPSTGAYGIVISAYITPGFKLQRCRVSGITAATSTTTNQDVIQLAGNSTGYEISNCTIRGGYRGVGIYGGSTIPVNNVLINNNRFYKSSSAGFRAQYSHNLQFTRNVVDSCGASGFLAAQIAYCSTAVVTLNRIDLDGGGGFGFTSCYSTNAARTKVNNNFVTVTGNAAGSGGIYLQDVRFADVYYNSFNIQVFDSYQVYAAQISNGGTGLRIQNNSFVTTPGNAIVNNIDSQNAIEIYSYNNLFNGEPQINLPPNSVSLNPGYTSSSDLHLIPSNLNA
ncbi:MAG: right-handed parallel beta-helix repeat-containing protein, partial [Bacteroidia bacterium]